ncbi:hypothetical protein SEA_SERENDIPITOUS_9 [Mycobacterium phage Serendipitous]|uniref:DUF1360 domain-containing protein n=1 Tax=Mycobacterium phage Serendipitous TaxID=2301619 RepID=A0A385UG20_9CAUD|nr:hypothetical protein I5G64_gp09 [Mycobacterium phage Serendipitous]AYB70551.1 hypothetical protein SEA_SERENDIPITOUS_9 [Mycobacterium phage Serendipitous]
MTLIVLGVYVLVVARLTRLINSDTILDRPRLAIITRARASRMDANEARALGQDVRATLLERRARRWAAAMYWVQCPWCVGMWIALASAIAPVLILGWHWAAFLPVALATSHLVGVCARFADTEEMAVVEDDDQ